MKKLTFILLMLISIDCFADTITLPPNNPPRNDAITQYCKETTQNIDGKQVIVTICRLTNGKWYILQ